jgi:hypothetical protein
MGLLGAFVLGYWMGTRAGEDGMRSMMSAGLKILQSEEFQSTLAGVTGMARGALGQVLDKGAERGLRAA